MGRRTVLLIVAVLVALLGTVLVFSYVKGIDNRAREGQETVEVLYTKAAIGLGTTASAAESSGAFETRKIPRDATAEGALSSTSPIQNQVALAPISAGQPVVSSQWGAPGTQQSALPVPSGQLGVSVQLGDPNRVAGFVVPGSQVAIFVTGEAGASAGTAVLLPKVTVLAVGPTAVATAVAGTTNTEAVPTAILTFALTQADAQKVIFSQSVGELYLGLRTTDSKVAKGSPTTAGNLFG